MVSINVNLIVSRALDVAMVAMAAAMDAASLIPGANSAVGSNTSAVASPGAETTN